MPAGMVLSYFGEFEKRVEADVEQPVSSFSEVKFTGLNPVADGPQGNSSQYSGVFGRNHPDPLATRVTKALHFLAPAAYDKYPFCLERDLCCSLFSHAPSYPLLRQEACSRMAAASGS
jgi:hypothetical protein